MEKRDIYILIGLFLVGAYLLNKATSKVAGVFSKSPEDLQRTKDTVRVVTDGIVEKKLSYSKPTFESWATNMYLAMKGVGTDERSVRRILGYMKNTNDLKYFIKVFGVRDNMNLFEWIRDEIGTISSPWGVTISNLNEDLAKKNIPIRF